MHLWAGEDSAAAGLWRTLWESDESAGASLSAFAGYGLAIAALFTLLRPSWPVLLCVVLWFGGEAAAPIVDGDHVLATLQHVLRIAMPLVLMLVDFWPPRCRFSIGRSKVSLGLLRLALVTSVAAGGAFKLLAINAESEWLELLRGSAAALGFPASDGQINQALAVMMAVDIALAWSVLTSRNRVSLSVLAGWQIALAALAIAAEGPEGYAAFLLHTSSAGAPLAILLFWTCAVKEQPPVIVPG